MHSYEYIVERIDGDYAYLRRTDESEDDLKLVARAILPPEIMEGIRACLKTHCTVLTAPTCGILRRDFGNVAPLRTQNSSLSPTIWNGQAGTSSFQTRPG